MKKKIILGTANFGTRYGTYITSQAKSIEKYDYYLKHRFLSALDTAETYEGAFEAIIKYGLNSYDIQTKVKACNFTADEISENVLKSRSIINPNSKYNVLIHDGEEFIRQATPSKLRKLNKNIETLNSRGMLNNFGISLYTPEAYRITLESELNVDIVQLPLSPIDARWDGLSSLKSLKCHRVQGRSLFLQGLLLNKNLASKVSNRKLSDILHAWWHVIDESNINPLEVCLSFVENNSFVDEYVVGFETIKQIDKLFNYKNCKLRDVKCIRTSDDCIDPRFWS